MRLYYYRYKPNFGDALNEIIWPRFLHKGFSHDAECDQIFVGIGTLLNERLPKARLLHIFGSGVGYGSIPLHEKDSWKIHFVRGPLTASKLGIHPSFGISDPAILLHRFADLNISKIYECSFMPHYAIDSPRYRKLCESIGLNYISPLSDCNAIITAISKSNRLICSAMHGAIAAEALRVPWLPVLTSDDILTSKWDDWTESMQLRIRFAKLPALWPEVSPRLSGRAIGALKTAVVRKELNRLSRSDRFILGSEKVLEERLRRIEEQIEIFNRVVADAKR